MSERVLFTGSREWTDEVQIGAVIGLLPVDAIVIHGNARGVDKIVDRLARARGLQVLAFDADWDQHGNAAGPIRNQQMLDEGKPTSAYAFPLPSSVGTWDMVQRLRENKIPVAVRGQTPPVLPAALSSLVDGFDLRMLRSFDLETPKFRGGYRAPRIVCGSTAKLVDGVIVGRLLSKHEVLQAFKELLDGRYTMSLANGSYDLAIMAHYHPELQKAIFKALEEGRVHDILSGECLNAIYHGTLGLDPRTGSDMRNPSTGKVTKRYSLALCTDLVLGRTDAKQNDVWRESYVLLEDFDPSTWPFEARQYPIDDARNQFEVAAVQLVGRRDHVWTEIPGIPGAMAGGTMCRHCGERPTLTAPSQQCLKAPPVPHKNLENLPAQTEAAFALHLGACHSLRTDPEKVEKLSAEAEEKNRVAVERFQKKGWIRDAAAEERGEGKAGTENTIAIKLAIALAYGASGKCEKCGGTGRVKKYKEIDCRGEKAKGRYQGCRGPQCETCHGRCRLTKDDGESACKNLFNEAGDMVEAGCDGVGLDLSTAPTMPRTDKMGVGTDRDAKMESGDEDMADFGEDEHQKSLNTYIPYLRTGIDAPLFYSPNVLVSTGRLSYEESPLHQMPRSGGERGCIRARGAWCGYPIEMVFGSTDYEAGELCCLAQFCYWIFGYSQMMNAINASGKPGILHSDLAAAVLGISLEEFLVRLKAKDKQAIDFRQSSKPMNFGKPAGMGAPKIVLTNRKKSAGFTTCERGPARNKKGEAGYWGIRFCVLIGGASQCGVNKIMKWKDHSIAPVCKACVEVVENILTPAYFSRYPEIRDYFKWAGKLLEDAKKADKMALAPSAVWDAEANRPRIIRERGCRHDEFTAFCNNSFQSMLADIGKHAFVTATKECYLGEKADGSSSPLAGCRLSIHMHDEPLSELIRETAHISGPRIGEIMEQSGRLMAPDVAWRAETALMDFWYKGAEPVYVDGKLVPWVPEL